MNTDDLLNMADDPRFIPSIYNYCDRWCERCPFTARCLNYAMGAEMEGREDQVKLMRALSGKEDDDNTDPLDEHPKDSDGSAKIALIGMDRSLAAWAILLRAFPQRETETLRLLAYLERIRRLTEQAFPNARAFVRPGFDGLVEEEPAEGEGELWEEVWNEVWETPSAKNDHETKR